MAHVYRLCVVTTRVFNTQADHVVFDMEDVDIIMGMDRLFPYHAILNYISKTITLSMPDISLIVW